MQHGCKERGTNLVGHAKASRYLGLAGAADPGHRGFSPFCSGIPKAGTAGLSLCSGVHERLLNRAFSAHIAAEQLDIELRDDHALVLTRSATGAPIFDELSALLAAVAHREGRDTHARE